MTSQWRHKWRMSKTPKIAENGQNRHFFAKFQTKIALFSNDVCQRMLTHISNTNKPNKYDKTYRKCTKKPKTRFMCNFNGKSKFSLTQRAVSQRSVITLGPIFIKMVLKWAEGLKEKSQKGSARKNIEQRRYNKNFGGGADSAPRYF